MKIRILSLGFTLLATASSLAQIAGPSQSLALPEDTDIPTLKTTGKAAIQSVLAQFASQHAGSDIQSYVVLPLKEDIDNGYFTLQFENAFTQTAGSEGFKLYTRENEQLAAVMKEPGFVSLYEDVVAAETIQKLALVGAQAVIIPRIDADAGVDGALTLSASISVHEVSSARKIWGDEVSMPVPGKLTPEQWLIYIGIGLAIFAVLILLVFVKRMIGRASRPR